MGNKLKRNNSSNGRQYGKLLWYDPNPTDNEPISLEDLTISVDLEVTTKARSVILVGPSSASVTNSGHQNPYTVNFFYGSKNNNNNGGQTPNQLSTHYSDIEHLGSEISNDDYEALGIESVNIDFNSSYAPTVKIKFIDIRGAAMFSSGGKNKYRFFFEMPYPLFKLTIKGYYGKSVQYCLHLIRFNASFNSQTGNFEIDCDFIGYTYALLADMLMGLVRASVTTTRGKAIFKTIKSEYKNQVPIITLDELVKKISDVNGTIEKIESSESSKNLAQNEKVKILIDDLKQIVLNHLDEYAATGLKLFTKSYSNGVIVLAYDASKENQLKTLNTTYRNVVKTKLEEIGKELDIATTDTDKQKVLTELDIIGQTPQYNKFIKWLDNGLAPFLVSDVKDSVKLDTELQTAFWKGSRLKNMKITLKGINYGSTTSLYLTDLSKAIQGCDNAQVYLENANDKAVKTANEKLRTDIRTSLGFDPTIRNLFRVLCISTEVFLQCLLEVSREAENDTNGKRAKALEKLRNGLDINNSSKKVFPWPEYRKSNKTSDGYYEEWMGNENIPIADVPELRFTEELMAQMLSQAREDKYREAELNGETSWYPISVIDTPVNNGLTARMTKNPYKIALIEDGGKDSDGKKVTQPIGIYQEALRALMYRGFLLFGVANKNNISDKMVALHGKLEAENLYDVLVKMPDIAKAKEIKDKIANQNTPDSIYDLFKNGATKLPANFPQKNFFEEDGNTLIYKQIINDGSNRSYIPINGNFNTFSFHVKRGELHYSYNTDAKLPSIIKLRENGTLFVGNHANHTRIVNEYGTRGASDGNDAGNIDNNDGKLNKPFRSNYIYNDGAINVKIINADSYESNGLAPTYGSAVLSAYSTASPINHKDIEAAILREIKDVHYTNPTSGRYLANTYNSIKNEAGSNASKFTNDNYTKGNTVPTLITFFNQGDEISDIKDAVTIELKIYEFAYNGFATAYDSKKQVYGWHDYNTTKKNGKKSDGLFKIDDSVSKTLLPHYTNYGKNKDALLNAINNDKIYIPKIEYCVDSYFSYSLFGSRFYYYQNSLKAAKKNADDTTYVDVGTASRAFLFLHCFPFQGVTRKAGDKYQAYDKYMFDFNNLKDKGDNGWEINETSNGIYPDGNSKPEILSIKALFRLHNAFIEAPKIWTLFIGAILWRLDYYNKNNNADPIRWTVPKEDPEDDTEEIKGLIANWFVAKDKDGNWYDKNPRVDEFLSVERNDNYVSAGMHFNFEDTILRGQYPLSYVINKDNKIETEGHYSRVDETLMGLPAQAKAEFINEFLEWAGKEFTQIQNQLEIDFDYNPDNVNKNTFLQYPNEGYIARWQALEAKKTVYDATATLKAKALDLDDVKTILGQNIVDNYIMVTPISNTDDRKIDYGQVSEGKYIKGQYAYNMELAPNGKGMELIRNLLLDKVYIQNVRPEIWVPPNLLEPNEPGKRKKRAGFKPITVKKDRFMLFLTEFHTQFKAISVGLEEVKEKEEDAIERDLFKTMDDDKIKLNIYRTLMSIYQKWVGGTANNLFIQCSYNESDTKIADYERTNNKPRLIDSFRFLDRSFNDIGDEFYINPQFFHRTIKENRNASFFDIANKILSDNNFNFIPLPTFVNFNKPADLADIFEPYPYNDTVTSGPSFVCVYAGQSSSHLDLGIDSNYPDDGIFITVDESGDVNGLPTDLNNSKPLTVYETNLPVFTVNYGQQNQNYFKDVKLDQSEFSETAESLEIIDDISAGGDKRKNVMVGQNLFNVYQKRSYSCEVEMLGCPLIQPMMYFQLNNIPMFRGLYLIIKVSHTIKPNTMTTTFKGVRVKRTKTPLLTASDVIMNILGTESKSNTNSSNGGTGGTGGGGGTGNFGNVNTPNLCEEWTGKENLTPEQITENKRIVVRFFKAQGLNQNQVAGILGNFDKESSFNHTVGNKSDLPTHTTDYGIIQYNSGTIGNKFNNPDCLLGDSDYKKSIGCIRCYVGETLEKQLTYTVNNYANYATWATYTEPKNDAYDSGYWFARKVEVCAGCTVDKDTFRNSTHPNRPQERAERAVEYAARLKDPNDDLFWDKY